MTGSVALDVTIGLVFVFTLYSLFTTTIVEIISSLIRLRSSFLEKGIQRMLDDGSHTTSFSESFYKQPLIKYLGSGSLWGLIKKPSYLSAQNFSKSLLDLLKDAHDAAANNNANLLPEHKVRAVLEDPNNPFAKSETIKFIRSLLDDAHNDLDKFKTLLEQWYDDTMERVSSWYKKWIQVITIVVGFVLAILFNVDTIEIATTLSHDPDARAQYIVMAQKLSDNPQAREIAYGTRDSAQAAQQLSADFQAIRKQALFAQNVLSTPRKSDWTQHLPGWLITAFALSLGAPFWFDLLNKVVKLRNSVQPSAEARISAQGNTLPVSKLKREG